MPEGFNFREIRPGDNEQVARVIRTVMTEFGAVGEGFSIMDPEVDHMYEAYADPRARMYVIEKDGKIFGCGGFGPLAGADAHICELKKMYFMKDLRGLGFGKKLVLQSLDEARKAGFTQCYLETLARMEPANTLYRNLGFRPLEGPVGATGHGKCDIWYLLNL